MRLKTDVRDRLQPDNTDGGLTIRTIRICVWVAWFIRSTLVSFFVSFIFPFHVTKSECQWHLTFRRRGVAVQGNLVRKLTEKVLAKATSWDIAVRQLSKIANAWRKCSFFRFTSVEIAIACKARPFATEKDFTTIIDLQFGSTETGIINDSELIANLPFYCSIVSGNWNWFTLFFLQIIILNSHLFA